MARNYKHIEYKSSSFGRTATLMSNQESGWASISVTRLAILAIANATGPVYMFVVSGHLYRPLLSSQSWELRGKILGGFGTHPRRF